MAFRYVEAIRRGIGSLAWRTD